MNDALTQIFSNLDRWRHLPNYQLERRLDIFLTPYLQRAIERCRGVSLSPIIVPEMPLKQEQTNRSDKVDYVMFSQDGKTVFLIELKTDCASLRGEQDSYLARIKWRATLENLSQIVTATKSRRKYFHLLKLLERAGQITLHETLTDCFKPAASPRFASDWVTVVTQVEKEEVVFIAPTTPPDGRECITFDRLIETIDADNDAVAKLLREYLSKWQCEAGSVAPQ
jgi:hypothetical protein